MPGGARSSGKLERQRVCGQQSHDRRFRQATSRPGDRAEAAIASRDFSRIRKRLGFQGGGPVGVKRRLGSFRSGRSAHRVPEADAIFLSRMRSMEALLFFCGVQAAVDVSFDVYLQWESKDVATIQNFANHVRCGHGASMCDATRADAGFGRVGVAPLSDGRAEFPRSGAGQYRRPVCFEGSFRGADRL
ncbi:protein of unknown function [Aminobacter niigataensis]|nr:protein of unknown function [Aminobacter niigataensis]